MKGSNLVSIILLTKNAQIPRYQSLDQVMPLIPEEIYGEIILVNYNFPNNSATTAKRSGSTYNDGNIEGNVQHVSVQGDFASAVVRGIELSVGRFILVMDADHPYSKETIPELLEELLANPNLIIVVSRFVEGTRARKMSFIQGAMHKACKMTATYGLKIKNV